MRQGAKEIVRKAIVSEAEKLGQRIYALAVCSNHVHVVADNIDEAVGKVAGHSKRAGTMALRKKGFLGMVWTKGYDKRFCFDKKALEERIRYVQRHG